MTDASSQILMVGPETWAPQPDGVVAVDFETVYTSKYSIRNLGTWAYCHDERFNAYLVAVSDGRQTCVCHPSVFPWKTIAGRAWCSHNRDFDRAVFRSLIELGVVETNEPNEWHCTAALAAFLQLPRSLAGAVREAFGLDLDKKIGLKWNTK